MVSANVARAPNMLQILKMLMVISAVPEFREQISGTSRSRVFRNYVLWNICRKACQELALKNTKTYVCESEREDACAQAENNILPLPSFVFSLCLSTSSFPSYTRNF
jgi:hypothetical protein